MLFHPLILLGSFICASRAAQEQMKEIEKLFQTEFDYVEEFRILALRAVRRIRGSVHWKSLSLERIYHDLSFFQGAFVHITDELPDLPGTTDYKRCFNHELRQSGSHAGKPATLLGPSHLHPQTHSRTEHPPCAGHGAAEGREAAGAAAGVCAPRG